MKDLLLAASPESAHAFIASLVDELHACGVTVTVETGLQVECRDGGKSAGFFDINPVEFAVAIGKPFFDWFLVLVHEYGHVKQWQAMARGCSCI